MKNLALTSLLLCACGAPISMNQDSGFDAGVDAGMDAGIDSGTPMISLPLNFAAKVGTETFACSKTFTNLGTAASSWIPKDFRFYVSNVRLVQADGGERPYQLKDDGVWQGANVGLLDFEDQSAQCSNGTAATNAQLKGEAVAGPYTAVRFTLGLPFELNHRDATTAKPPFSSSALFWSWQSGYKFVRIDGNTTGLPNGHNVHLGSTGCVNDPMKPTVVTSCAVPNRVEVTLENFELGKNVVVADYGALVSGSNIDVDTAMTAPGCMSGSDPDCAPIFSRFGLPFGTTDAGTQAFFRVE